MLLYWRKLKDIALKVTDTEVKLTLPEQRSPKGRHFGIEGVVDIVREQGRTVLYDIKTHAAAAIRADPEPYEKQLNIYAYIWQNLRGQQLDETAVICTNFPEAIEQALQLRDEVALERELARWEPVIPFDFDANHVSETIREFGEVVDRIEDGDFAPPPAMFLESKLPNMRSVFAARVCVNCDARYSCASYRTYAQKARGHSGKIFRAYLEDVSTDTEREQRATALLDATPTAEELQSLTAQTQE